LAGKEKSAAIHDKKLENIACFQQLCGVMDIAVPEGSGVCPDTAQRTACGRSACRIPRINNVAPF
jgi:hypothetical protein